MSGVRLQSRSAFATGLHVSVTPASVLSSGSKLLALTTSHAPGNGQCIAVKDAALNSFTLVGDSGNPPAGFGGLRLWALDTPAGDVGTTPVITTTLDFNLTSNSCLLVQEVSGLLPGTLAALDGTPGSGNGQLASGTTWATGTPAYASSAAGEYLISCTSLNTNGGSFPVITGPGGPWAVDPSSLSFSNSSSELALAVAPSTGAIETDGWTVTGAAGTFQGWGVLIGAFKIAPSGNPSTAGMLAGDAGFMMGMEGMVI